MSTGEVVTGAERGSAAGPAVPAGPVTADEPVQLVSEGVVDGVEYVTVCDAHGGVVERHVPLNDRAKTCGC